MHTLVDFMTHVKGVEYVISVLAIAGFIMYLEILKPRPFQALREGVREDLEWARKTGYRNVLRTAGRAAVAPLIGAAYVIALPFLCAFAFFREVLTMAREAAAKTAGESAFFGWRPREAYLGGKKEKRNKKDRKDKEDLAVKKSGPNE